LQQTKIKQNDGSNVIVFFTTKQQQKKIMRMPCFLFFKQRKKEDDDTIVVDFFVAKQGQNKTMALVSSFYSSQIVKRSSKIMTKKTMKLLSLSSSKKTKTKKMMAMSSYFSFQIARTSTTMLKLQAPTFVSWAYHHVKTTWLVNVASITSAINTSMVVPQTQKQTTKYNKYYILF